MKSFLIEPWGQRVYVSSDPKRTMSRYNKHPSCAGEDQTSLEELLENRGMAMHFEGKGQNKPLFLFWLAPDQQLPQLTAKEWEAISTVFHEALHMAHYLMDYCGAPINMDSTETQAYLMEHIAEMVRKKLP